MRVPKHFQQLKPGDLNHVLTKEASGQLRRRVVADHGQEAAALSLPSPRPAHSPATLRARVLSTRRFFTPPVHFPFVAACTAQALTD